MLLKICKKKGIKIPGGGVNMEKKTPAPLKHLGRLCGISDQNSPCFIIGKFLFKLESTIHKNIFASGKCSFVTN